jgi:hypothetical protein
MARWRRGITLGSSTWPKYSPWNDLLGHHQLGLRRSLPVQFTDKQHRPPRSIHSKGIKKFKRRRLTWFRQPRWCGPCRGGSAGEVTGEQLTLATEVKGLAVEFGIGWGEVRELTVEEELAAAASLEAAARAMGVEAGGGPVGTLLCSG